MRRSNSKPNGASNSAFSPVRLGTDANIGNMTEPRADFNEHLLQCPGADDGTKDVEHGDVPVTDAVQHNHVPDKVGVGRW